MPDIKDFLNGFGTIAWGIVPSSEAVSQESIVSISKKLKDCIKLLSDKGVDTKNISSLVTPSCGLGTLEENIVIKIIKLTNDVSLGMVR